MTVYRVRVSHKQDRLELLRTYYHAARTESMTRAAKCIGVSQSAVSGQIRKLEKELETRFFERHGRRISRTRAGDILYRLVAPLVEGVDNLFLDFPEQLEDVTCGDVRIGTSHSIASIILPPRLAQFRRLYPKIGLKVTRGTVADASVLLLADEVDVLLAPHEYVPTGAARERIDFRVLTSYRLVLATPLGHPLAERQSVTPNEIVAYPVIVPRESMYTSRLGESPVQTLGIESGVVLQAGGWNTVKRHVEAGLGVAIVPSICITREDRISTIALPRYFERRTFGVFTRNDKPLSVAAERFVELLECHYAGDAESVEAVVDGG